jgi:hypothetical protein
MLIEHEKPDGDKAQFDITGHVPDPVSLSIIGCILIGGILAGRVKKRA